MASVIVAVTNPIGSPEDKPLNIHLQYASIILNQWQNASDLVRLFLMKKETSGQRSGCPINIALEIFGDRWSLLIVRDLMFKQRTTYREFLEAEEGIATNILAERLQRLETVGIIQKQPDPADGRKSIYQLTPKGIDLAPVLVEMILWSARHEKTAAPSATIREMIKNREGFIAGVRQRWEASRDK
jgi:DNA-binding HxlR family transcriptional regulator